MDLVPVHEELSQFVNAGVAGFILKDATFEDFVGTIRVVADGGRVLPPRMTGTLFSQIARLAVQHDKEEALSAVRPERFQGGARIPAFAGMANIGFGSGSPTRE